MQVVFSWVQVHNVVLGPGFDNALTLTLCPGCVKRKNIPLTMIVCKYGRDVSALLCAI